MYIYIYIVVYTMYTSLFCYLLSLQYTHTTRKDVCSLWIFAPKIWISASVHVCMYVCLRVFVLSVCSTLQCVAVCCGVLQCVAVGCRTLQCVAVCCSVCFMDPSVCLFVRCSVWSCIALCVCASIICAHRKGSHTLQQVCYRVLHCVATYLILLYVRIYQMRRRTIRAIFVCIRTALVM